MDHPLKIGDHFYKLGEDGKTAVSCSGAEWRAQFQAERHHIAYWTDGASRASVIFFGLRLGSHSPARLFELKTDTPGERDDITRYATYNDALASFRGFIARIRALDHLPTEEAWIADPITREKVPFK